MARKAGMTHVVVTRETGEFYGHRCEATGCTDRFVVGDTVMVIDQGECAYTVRTLAYHRRCVLGVAQRAPVEADALSTATEALATRIRQTGTGGVRAILERVG